MPNPNLTASLILFTQTSASISGGQYPFVEKFVSGT
jgi:hypothetical protein